MLALARGKNPHTSTEEKSFSQGFRDPGTLVFVDKLLKAHVEALLGRAGTNPTRASREAGLNPHFLRQWLSGRVRSPGAKQLQAVAAVLGVSLDELTTPPGQALDPSTYAGEPSQPLRIVAPASTRAPPLIVRHMVQAGAWLEQDADTQIVRRGPPVTADPRVGGEQWLELVEGDSIDKIAPPGAFLHVVGAASVGYAPRQGDVVVVERVRAQGGLRERSVKVIEQRRGGRLELWPASNNPRWSEPLRLTPESPPDADLDTEVAIVARVIGVYLPFPGGQR
ncbi:MAG: helix-turn-helix domain-containing protein [Hyphomonadaceae bacterium]|nr:helix-turn-helix domain-containing protein [Hyphomonadaceae bacterium]